MDKNRMANKYGEWEEGIILQLLLKFLLEALVVSEVTVSRILVLVIFIVVCQIVLHLLNISS